MSDNDLIRRGTAKQNIRDTLLEDDESYGDALWAINDCSAVPHEMTAREYENAVQRMRETRPIELTDWHIAHIQGDWEMAVAIVEKWAREHPEERSEDNVEARI